MQCGHFGASVIPKLRLTPVNSPSVDQTDLNFLDVGIREIERDRFCQPDWRLGIGKPLGVFGRLSLSALGEGREALLRPSGYTVTSFHCSIIARNHGSHHRTQFESHEITAFLRKSGIGEVYPVRDAKLKRVVAIKSLPDESSPDRNTTHSFSTRGGSSRIAQSRADARRRQSILSMKLGTLTA